jgi:hypothetical protein
MEWAQGMTSGGMVSIGYRPWRRGFGEAHLIIRLLLCVYCGYSAVGEEEFFTLPTSCEMT